jgi:DnaJ-class molecular chaperone
MLTLHESLFGFHKVLFNHLDGRQIKCKHSVKDGVIKPGTFKCIRREGMPYSEKHDLRGDLYIEFEVEFPDTIIIPQPRECKDSDDALSLVKSCFPEPVPMAENDPVQECELHETSRNLVSFIYIDINTRIILISFLFLVLLLLKFE